MRAERARAGLVDDGRIRDRDAARDGRDKPSRWSSAGRWLTWAFMLGVLGLVAHHARQVDWPAVGTALRELPWTVLAAAAALAATSHAIYASYDLIGRRHLGHAVPPWRVVGITFVSYAFNLNLGALVGGIAMRYRLYARQGLEAAATTQVLTLSMITNWLGYLLLAGTLFVVAPLTPPRDWDIAAGGLRGLGAGMVALGLAWIGACFFSPRRRWVVRGREVELPSGPVSLWQAGLSMVNWAVIGAVIHVLLQGRVDFPAVLSALLVAAVAGVVTHVPAGLGVLEAVFVALIGPQAVNAAVQGGEAALSTGVLLAALLAYRAIYYLAPLALAAALLPWLDGRRAA